MQQYVRLLEPGTAFRVNLGGAEHLDYRLIYANNSRAYVEPVGRSKRQVRSAAGDVIAEFEDRSGRVNISVETAVSEVLRLQSMDVDIDDLLGDSEIDDLTGEPVQRQKAVRKRVAVSADGLRVLNPDTKRGKVVAFFKAGKTWEFVCKELGIKKACAFGHMYDARKFNGVQYEIKNDKVKVLG